MRKQIIELPRDLWKPGRPSAALAPMIRAMKAAEIRPEVERAACLHAEGKTIPRIAAILGVGERTVKRWLRSTRHPRLRFETISADGEWAVAPKGPCFAFELACPRCAVGRQYRVVAGAPKTIHGLVGQALGETRCPTCEREGAFRLLRFRPLEFAEVDAWRQTKDHAERGELYDHPPDAAAAEDLADAKSHATRADKTTRPVQARLCRDGRLRPGIRAPQSRQ
jgi:hypothetical protein